MPQDATTETSSARLFSPVKAEKTPQKGGKDHEISNQLSPSTARNSTPKGEVESNEEEENKQHAAEE